ncbi:MAG: phosphoserine phosphatase [Thermoproteota archaeon]|nr:phosphoserine phosphatase [Thermoproteota archaeon]
MPSESSTKERRLVVFDVEGVILPKRRYLLLEAIRRLGIRGTFLILALGFLYEVQIISLESAFRRIYRCFKGVALSDSLNTFKEMPIIPGALEVFQTLKNHGYFIALLSSGIPSPLVDDLAKRLGANYAFGLETEVIDGRLTGEIFGDVLKPRGKAIILKSLLDEYGFSKKNCTVVADDRNNLSLTSLCNKIIGYNPDFMLAVKSDYVVRGSLRETIHYIEPSLAKGFVTPAPIEFFRETIHIGSILIPIFCKYLQINIRQVGGIIILLTIVYAFSEYFRLRGKRFPLVSKITSKAVVGEESWGFASSPIIFATGITISLFLFSIPVNFAAITVLTLGDGSATIFGKKFGRRVLFFNKSKSLEGTLLGFAAAFLGTLIFIDPRRGLVAAIVGMIVEAIPLPINDNITIPILSGISMLLIS